MHAGGKTPSFLLLNVQLFQKIRTFVSDLWNESILTRKTNGFIIETKRGNAGEDRTEKGVFVWIHGIPIHGTRQQVRGLSGCTIPVLAAQGFCGCGCRGARGAPQYSMHTRKDASQTACAVAKEKTHAEKRPAPENRS